MPALDQGFLIAIICVLLIALLIQDLDRTSVARTAPKPCQHPPRVQQQQQVHTDALPRHDEDRDGLGKLFGALVESFTEAVIDELFMPQETTTESAAPPASTERSYLDILGELLSQPAPASEEETEPELPETPVVPIPAVPRAPPVAPAPPVSAVPPVPPIPAIPPIPLIPPIPPLGPRQPPDRLQPSNSASQHSEDDISDGWQDIGWREYSWNGVGQETAGRDDSVSDCSTLVGDGLADN